MSIRSKTTAMTTSSSFPNGLSSLLHSVQPLLIFFSSVCLCHLSCSIGRSQMGRGPNHTGYDPRGGRRTGLPRRGSTAFGGHTRLPAFPLHPQRAKPKAYCACRTTMTNEIVDACLEHRTTRTVLGRLCLGSCPGLLVLGCSRWAAPGLGRLITYHSFPSKPLGRWRALVSAPLWSI
jgi:hypothetical protein